jgi:hypothetical protein
MGVLAAVRIREWLDIRTSVSVVLYEVLKMEIMFYGLVQIRAVACVHMWFCAYVVLRIGAFHLLSRWVKVSAHRCRYLCVSRPCRGALACCAASREGRLAPAGLHR